MINLLLIINKPIERANDLAGYIGRNLSIFAMGLDGGGHSDTSLFSVCFEQRSSMA